MNELMTLQKVAPDSSIELRRLAMLPGAYRSLFPDDMYELRLFGENAVWRLRQPVQLVAASQFTVVNAFGYKLGLGLVIGEPL